MSSRTSHLRLITWALSLGRRRPARRLVGIAVAAAALLGLARRSGARVRPHFPTTTGTGVLLGMWTALLLAVAAVLAASAGASPLSSTSTQIYFYGNIGNAVNSTVIKNPLLVRPSTVLLFEDGSWVLKDLHWSGWGSSVARASGVSSASPCGPACPTSRWRNSAAQFTLSSPGAVLGHEVYRCFQLTVPSYPSSDQHDCLGHHASFYGYLPVPAAAPKPTSSAKSGFFGTPTGNIDCNYGVGLSDVANDFILCGVRSGLVPREPLPATGCGRDSDYSGNVVSLAGTGAAHPVPCLGDCGPFCYAHPPVLHYGQTWNGDAVSCTSSFSGLTCRNKSGHGFFLSRQSWRLF
jgi:hypothetical protein